MTAKSGKDTKIPANSLTLPPDYNKHGEPCRPRSKLQKIHTQENWVTNFCLHPLPAHRLSEIKLSLETNRLLIQHNLIVAKLKASIKYDADRTSAYTRELRKALSLK